MSNQFQIIILFLFLFIESSMSTQTIYSDMNDKMPSSFITTAHNDFQYTSTLSDSAQTTKVVNDTIQLTSIETGSLSTPYNTPSLTTSFRDSLQQTNLDKSTFQPSIDVEVIHSSSILQDTIQPSSPDKSTFDLTTFHNSTNQIITLDRTIDLTSTSMSHLLSNIFTPTLIAN